MKRITFLLIMYGITYCGYAQTIFEGDAILTSQEEVDTFGSNEYTEITGRLIIQSGIDQIIDLSPLSTIERVATSSPVTGFDDALTIRDNTELATLEGLSSLVEIEGGILIENNTSLINLMGLESLTFLNALGTQMVIRNNSSLMILDGLENIIIGNTGSIEIIGNINLTSIEALSNIQPSGLTIQDNPSLISLEGINLNQGNGLDIINNDALMALPNITGMLRRGLTIADNDNLVDLSGFSNVLFQTPTPFPLTEIEIFNNDNLESLTGLNTNLESVASVKLMDNDVLSDISLLENLNQGIVEIVNNQSITSISSLINFVEGSLLIQGNNLTSLDGLQNFTTIFQLEIVDTDLVSLEGINPSIINIENTLRLEDNPNLTLPLTEFQNLLNIGNNAIVTDFQIINCDAIYSLDDFSNLTSINADIEFSGNDTLFDFCGIAAALNNGFSRGYNVNSNNFNPGFSDVISGNCQSNDGDIDMDSVNDGDDNCPLTSNMDQTDLDSDGFGDVCDVDIDGDGFSNEEENECGSDPLDSNSFCMMLMIFYEDADMDGLGDPNVSVEDFEVPDGFVDNADDLCPNDFDPSNANFDGDDEGDVCDEDDDNDGFSDEDEIACGTDPLDNTDFCMLMTFYEDADSDGLGDPNVFVEDVTTPDGFVDNDEDLCPNDFDPSNANFDGDELGDVCDEDDDNDGNPDMTDPNPLEVVVNPDLLEITNVGLNQINILENDDFLGSADTSLEMIAGTANPSQLAFDPLTGIMSYTVLASEAGETLTVVYEVCNIPTGVCATTTVALQIDASLSVDDISDDFGIKVYPNPVKDILYIKNPSTFPISSLKVFNIEGQLLIHAFDVNEGVDMASFPSGLYLIEIVVGGQKIVKKIIR